MDANFSRRMQSLALAAALVGTLVPALARAQSAAEEEQTKQTTRQIADSISSRISGGALTQLPPPGTLNTWGTTTYNAISGEKKNDFDLTIFQLIAGVDKRFGDWIVGGSGAYSLSNIDTPGTQRTNGFSLSPYLAYVFSDNFFLNGIAGYVRSDPNGSDFDSNGMFTEWALNALYPVGNLILKGKVGYRFTYNDIEDVEGTFGNSYANTAIVGTEVSYIIGPFVPYVRLQYEHFEPKHGDPKDFVDQDTMYSYFGTSYEVTEALAVGAAFSSEFFNSKTDNYGGILELRAQF